MNLFLTVNDNSDDIAQAMGEIASQQVPYAAALALTRTAQDVQAKLRSTMGEFFELKNKFSQSGVQINRAEKRDWPLASSEVGVDERREYLIDHALGNSKRTGSNGSRVAIPDTANTWPSKSENVKLTSSGRVPKSKRVGTLKRKKTGKRRPFVIRGKSGNEVLAIREGKGRYPLKILYAFRRDVQIPKTWAFEKIAQGEAQAVYDKRFNEALAKAIDTAKDKAERSSSRSKGRTIRAPLG